MSQVRVLISAAEASSDLHGAQLIRALRSQCEIRGLQLQVEGIGGPAMQAQGLRPVYDARNLLSMGFSEVLVRLPRILKGLRKISQQAIQFKPQVAVLLDYPDFHFKLAARLSKLSIPLVYYIPPKVWVWRSGRLSFLRQHFERILGIFPFEEPVYREAGAPFVFVGNPLLDELPLKLSRSEARARLGIPEAARTLVLMPGSRPAEVEKHLEIFLDTALSVATQKREKLRVCIPLPEPGAAEAVKSRVSAWSDLRGEAAKESLETTVSWGDSSVALVAADVGLIKSGTSTLEAAALGCPHVLVYRTNALSAWLFRHLVRYPGPVGLVNLLAAWDPQRPNFNRSASAPRLTPEVLAEEVSVERLTAEVLQLWGETPARTAQLEGFAKVRSWLSAGGGSPSETAAKEILEVALSHVKQVKAVRSRGRRRPWFFLSLLWSLATALVRWAQRVGWVKPRRLSAGRVVSIGNLQAGGTGKTPLVARIAREAHERGLSVCILSRGYRAAIEKSGIVLPPLNAADSAQSGVDSQGSTAARPSLVGDEPALLRCLAPHAWIAVGSQRWRSYESACRLRGEPFDLVLLDDGFQHWPIARDLDLLAVTSTAWGEKPFRDFSRAARQAQLCVWTKGDRFPQALAATSRWIRARVQLTDLSGKTLFLVSGVGDPEALESSVLAAGARVLEHVVLRDHAHYERSSVERWLEQAGQAGAQLATTGKDWVKWSALGIDASRVLVLEPEFQWDESWGGGTALWNQIVWGE